MDIVNNANLGGFLIFYNYNMKLTASIENFTQEELQCKCGCKLFNIDNEFLIRLQAYRYLLGLVMIPTSACRCVKHNKNVGGEVNSCHESETKKGTAIDFYCTSMQYAYDLACRCGLFNEVIWYKHKRFIHLALDRKQKENYFVIN